MKKAVILVLVLSVIMGVLFWAYSAKIFTSKKQEDKNITLTYWGLTEDETTIKPIIEAYQTARPNIKIIFNKQSLLNYRPRLETKLEAGEGPDVFTIHASWLPMLVDNLSTTPTSIIGLNEFNQTFYPVAQEALVLQNKIYGLPQDLDGLALYYNEDILSAAGVQVPKTWQDFLETAKKVTVKSQSGQIQTAGAALGTATNVDFWPEILSLLFFQQPSGSPATPANQSGVEVLQFYTSFVTDPKNKTWDTTLPTSTQMFNEGRLAFYFGPSKQAAIFAASNPNLHFRVVPVPQLPGKNVTVSSFWAKVVSIKSAHQKEAWDFAKYLTSAEVLQAVEIGKVYPRQDMASLQVSDPIFGAYINQAPFAKSWYLNSDLGDDGLNNEMIKLYGDAVGGILQGQDVSNTVQTTQVGIKQILDKYKPTPTPSKK